MGQAQQVNPQLTPTDAKVVSQGAAFIKTMLLDLHRCIQEVSNADAENRQFWARMYIRSYSTWIEGTIWLYKKMIASSHGKGLELTLPQQLYFSELDWRINDDGEIQTSLKKLKTIDNIKTFIKASGALVGISTPFNSHGWRGVASFYKVRDALTHPTNFSHLEINVEDLTHMDAGRVWLNNHLDAVRAMIVKRVGGGAALSSEASPHFRH